MTNRAHKLLGSLHLDNIANEVIDFQLRDSFGTNMETIVRNMLDDLRGVNITTKEYVGPPRKMMEDLIYKRLGIKIEIHIIPTLDCLVNTPIYSPVHILSSDELIEIASMYLKEFPKLQDRDIGTIDLKKAKVGGVFSDTLCHLYIGMKAMEKVGINSSEITAAILHELGHVFTRYEFSNRLERTNQALAKLSASSKDTDIVKERTYCFREISDIMDIDPKEFDDLIEENSKIIFGFKLFKKYIRILGSQLPISKYNSTAGEQLADNFATRFGYGRQLVSCLEKWNKADGGFLDEPATLFIYLDLIKNMVILASIIAVYIGVAFMILIMLSIFILTILTGFGEKNRDMTYDEVRIRYKRVRQQYIEMISTINLSEDELNRIVRDVHYIDDVIDKTAPYRSLFDSIANYVLSKNKAIKEDIKIQQLLEELTHNNLFLKSAELKRYWNV